MMNNCFLNFDNIEQYNTKRIVKPGDVICVKRKIGYYHYGIYESNKKVIHFANIDDKWEKKTAVIHETTLSNFIKNSDTFFVCVFGEEYSEQRYMLEGEISNSMRGIIGTPNYNYNPIEAFISFIKDIKKLINKFKYHLYSPEETIQRARSMIGKSFYNICFNNCEHFAIWCKTGIHESSQVNEVLEYISKIKIPVESFN